MVNVFTELPPIATDIVQQMQLDHFPGGRRKSRAMAPYIRGFYPTAELVAAPAGAVAQLETDLATVPQLSESMLVDLSTDVFQMAPGVLVATVAAVECTMLLYGVAWNKSAGIPDVEKCVSLDRAQKVRATESAMPLPRFMQT